MNKNKREDLPIQGIPDAEAGYSILGVPPSKTPHNISREDLRAIASRAHGYVGADLSAVVREAGTMAIKRWLATNSGTPSAKSSSSTQLMLTFMRLFHPSDHAMRSLFAHCSSKCPQFAIQTSADKPLTCKSCARLSSGRCFTRIHSNDSE